MPTILYGLALAEGRHAAAGIGGIAGIGGTPVRALPGAVVSAIVSTVDAKPEPSLQTVREHDAVLRQYVRAGATVAAVRFGQLFHDDAACIAEVVERAGRIEALLREHRGCVEMRVLLPVRDDHPAAARDASQGPGRAYLESLRERGQGSPRLALGPMLGPSVREERVEGFATRKGDARGIAFAHLVHRDDLDRYREAVRGIPALAEARVVGPLPLYSFAEPAP